MGNTCERMCYNNFLKLSSDIYILYYLQQD